MGTHWFLDLSTENGTISWEASNLLPVVTMYDEESENPTNTINAIFFASPVVQQSILPPDTNDWDLIPLPTPLMCKNFCNSDCGFHDTSVYSTMHIFMNDRSKVTCHDGCKIGCCSN